MLFRKFTAVACCCLLLLVYVFVLEVDGFFVCWLLLTVVTVLIGLESFSMGMIRTLEGVDDFSCCGEDVDVFADFVFCFAETLLVEPFLEKREPGALVARQPKQTSE